MRVRAESSRSVERHCLLDFFVWFGLVWFLRFSLVCSTDSVFAARGWGTGTNLHSCLNFLRPALLGSHLLSSGSSPRAHKSWDLSERCLQTNWPLFCYIHLKPRQPSLGQNHSLINTFHRVNGVLAPPPAWGSSQSHGPCSVPRKSPAWRQSVPAPHCHASASPFSSEPGNALPASTPIPSCVILSFTCSHFHRSIGHSLEAPDLFFILPFSRQNDGSTLENPLGKGWAILHFRQACPGDFESSRWEPFGCGTISVGHHVYLGHWPWP